jgi:hypothetical protein
MTQVASSRSGIFIPGLPWEANKTPQYARLREIGSILDSQPPPGFPDSSSSWFLDSYEYGRLLTIPWPVCFWLCCAVCMAGHAEEWVVCLFLVRRLGRARLG